MNDNVSNEIQIDSVLLRLPIQYVEVINQSLLDKHTDYTVNEDTGEMTVIRQKHKPSEYTKITINCKSYFFEFKVKKIKDGTRELYMLVNAKMLENKYLEGITVNNIKEVYNRLIACNVAQFSFEDFVNNSKCTNIDLCKNFINKDLTEQLIKIKQRLKNTPKKNPTPKLIKNAKQQSLRFIPKEDASNAKPHILIYNKECELMVKSYVFADEHLKDQNINDLCRIEFRIKDKKHANYLGIKNNNLITLLKLSQQFKQEILHKFTMCYLDHPKPKKNKITPTKQVYLNCMNELLGKGNNFSNVAESLTNGLPRNRKSEKYKELKELYYTHIYTVVEVAKSESEIYV